MVFKNLCVLVLWTEGFTQLHQESSLKSIVLFYDTVENKYEIEHIFEKYFMGSCYLV